MREIEILDNPQLVAERASELFVAIAKAAIERSGRFTVALSGGSTPKALYRKLSNTQIEWDRAAFYFGDERVVPPDHPDSNFRMAYESLLLPLHIGKHQVHRWKTELNDPHKIAEEYEMDLAKLGSPPSLDLVLLGIGEDCHTASLFPGTVSLHESSKAATANWVPKLGNHRLTITFPVLNASANVLVIATGRSKAEALHKALKGDRDTVNCPIQGVEPVNGHEYWILDKESASCL